VRPTQRYDRRGVASTVHIVKFRVGDNEPETVEIEKAEVTRQDIEDAIEKHLAWKRTLTGVYET